MFKIHIKETFPDNHNVTIQVDGSLDLDTVPILKNVCEHHWANKRKIQLHLEGLIRISREGVDFLQGVQSKAILVNAPQFIKLEGQGAADQE